MRFNCTRCGVPNEVGAAETPPPKPIDVPVRQEHGSLMPTNGASGVTEKAPLPASA